MIRLTITQAAYVGPLKSQNARMSSATKASAHAPA
jgi:hypothetical protein